MCPFCDWRPRPSVEVSEVAQRADHIGTFHRDRLAAALLYQRVLAQTGDIAAARAAANQSVLHRGPGQYERVRVSA